MPPVLVMVSDNVPLLPTFTLPKLRLVGFEPSAPAATPVPDRDAVVDGVEALLVTVSVALKVAAAFGVNVILKVALCPLASVTGNVGEVNAKYFVEMEALLMVTDALPEFVAVRVRVLLVFGVTFPKSRLPLARTRFPLCCPPPPPERVALTPMQPTRTARRDRVSTAATTFSICVVTKLLAGIFRIKFHEVYPAICVGLSVREKICDSSLGLSPQLEQISEVHKTTRQMVRAFRRSCML